MSESLFDELKRYVGFTQEDGEQLRAVRAFVEPHFVRISEVFYARILEHEGARTALIGGESRVGHLKVTLQQWLGQLFQGPWDEAYYQKRARIGRVHVRISLPQHYMFGAMHVLGRELHALLHHLPVEKPRQESARLALQKLLDLELAIMLHTYREDSDSQHARSERMATFGQLVASIGHELRNPLGVIETSAFLLRKTPELSEQGIKHLSRIEAQVHLANQMVEKLLDMIRDRPVHRQNVNAVEVLQAAVAALSCPADVHIHLAKDEVGGVIQCDATQLRQVLINLLQNAIDALPRGGDIQVAFESHPEGATVAVDDSGTGVVPDIVHRLFEPLVTTKPAGIGLGLALVKRIAERHGGRVQLEASRLGGARFSVLFPRV
jgi:two-component system, NtrC family, sensor histidine kinase HydH